MTRWIILASGLMMTAGPALAQSTALPPTPAVTPPISSSVNSPAPTTPPERLAPPATLGNAGPPASAPFSAGPNSGLAGSSQIDPQYGSGPRDPDRMVPGK